MSDMLDIDSAWNSFCGGNYDTSTTNLVTNTNDCIAPKCGNLYISTRTKISYLSQEIDLKSIFWKIPVIPYHLPCEGVVKKQMKFNSISQEQQNIIQNKIIETTSNNSHKPYVEEHIITRIVNPEGRIKFKDVRKISIGLCKKDITSYRCKKKSAFYNCFVVILRIKINNIFKEIHVKVFNTGKLEIPGIQCNESLEITLNLLIKILSPLVISPKKITYLKDKSETVLINSNFNCGYFINREKLFDILKLKYGINSAFDPCSYPGIQSEFYYNYSLEKQNGKQTSDENNKTIKVSFMIFRTGSVLIVGKCPENILEEIYLYLKNLLQIEYLNIRENTDHVPNTNNEKSKVPRKKSKTILVKLNTNK